MDLTKEIPHDDVPGLTLLCALNEGEKIPDAVLVQYWRVRRLVSRMGHCGPLSVENLMSVGLNAGLGYERKVDIVEESFADKVKNGKVKTGDRVKAKWRDKEQEATFVHICADGEVECQFGDHKNPRKIPANDVKAIETALENAA